MLTRSEPRSFTALIRQDFNYPLKEASTSLNDFIIIYNGSLLTFETTTGGLRKADKANASDKFAGLSIVEKNVKKSDGAPKKSDDNSEIIEYIRSGICSIKTAVGITNTAKCTDLTNNHPVFIASDNQVCVQGTADISSLILVGIQTRYVSDNEVWISLNEASGTGGGGAPDTYTNLNPSVIAVGGLEVGTTFNNQTLTNLFDAMLYPELFPTLTPPSNAFSLTESGLHEIAEVIATLHFTATFNRGSIAPAYGTSGFRSGLPSVYKYTGTGLPASFPSSSLTDNQTVSSYTVLTGVQTWGSIVSHLIGEQPKSSKGNDYDVPYPAGDTSNKTVTITGVYPTFATTVTLGVLTKQVLALMTSVYIQTNMVAEDGGGDKQTADFPIAWSAITGIQFYNTINSTWEWINGSKPASLTTFTVTATTHTIQGNVINYNRYTHNGSTIGARMLRWYTT